MINFNTNLFFAFDCLGGNVFIVAPQNQHFELLKFLLHHARDHHYDSQQVNQINNHLFRYIILDYLPSYIKEYKSTLTTLTTVFLQSIKANWFL